MDFESSVNYSNIEAFAKKYGSGKAQKWLSILGRQKNFHDAVATPVGEKLLGIVGEKVDVLHGKILKGEATETDIIAYSVWNEVAEVFALNISSYYANLETFKVDAEEAEREIRHAHTG